MKKAGVMILAAVAAFSLAGCQSSQKAETAAAATEAAGGAGENTEAAEASQEEDTEASAAEEKPETVTVTGLNGASEAVEVTVPYDPERVAVLDMAALDILDNLDLGDRVVGSANTALEYLQGYMEDDAVELLGTVKEADMEAVMACEPDVIFMGGRMSESYDALSEIAPVVRLTTDTSLGVLESTKKNAMTIAAIFGKEDEVDEKFADFDGRIAALGEIAEGKTAVVGMCTSGSFNVVGNGGRCSIIGVEVGFENLCDETASEGSSEEAQSGERAGGGREGQGGQGGERTGGSGNNSAHGSETSFELIVSLAPDYIFVMDRDAAIGTNGAQLAKDIMENELVMGTDAYKNGNLVILEHPAVWYTAEGGVTALGIMLSDLESALLN